MPSRHSLSRKRQRSRSRSRSESSSVEISQGPKRQSSHPPAEFWDNLSKIWLTTGALRELDRRNSSTRFYHAESKKERENVQFAPEFLSDSSPTRLEVIKNIAASGGPDLTDLRGYPIPQVMSCRKSSSRMQKSQADPPQSESAENTKTTKTTTRTTTSAYSRNFQQHMVEYGVYNYTYSYPNGQRTPKPNNLNEIMERLIRPRRSLSPSRFTETDYREVEQADADADNETPVATGVIPLIEGKYAHMNCRGQDLLFENLAPLTNGTLTAAKPDQFFGARPESLKKQIRSELSRYIVPSTIPHRPITPNFFLETKSPERKAAVVDRQALYNGALGARAMRFLQCYRLQEVPYDNNAYTITSTYIHGTLSFYATHMINNPERADGRPEYIMTRLMARSVTSDLKSLREGVTAYRNARDWTKEKRNEFIKAANERLAKAHSHFQHASSSSTTQQHQVPDLVSNMDDSSTSVGSAGPCITEGAEGSQRASKRVRIRSSESFDGMFDDEGAGHPPTEGASRLDTDGRME